MNLPKRKLTRLKNYDYSTPGAYFLTICTHKHNCIFSKIVGAIHESPENKLTPYGEIVMKEIQKLPERFDIEIPIYVIMPNHIHLLVIIKCDGDQMRAIRESPLHSKRSLISRIVGYLKMNVSKEIHLLYPEMKIWQRDFHDHIIRSENDFKKIWEYIDTNVIKWKYDRFYTNEAEL